MGKQLTLAGLDPPPRAKPRIMAKVVDAGKNVSQFECTKCGWNSGWVYDDETTVTQIKRGIPCEICNATTNRGSQ